VKAEEVKTSTKRVPTTETPSGGPMKRIGRSLELSRGAVMRTLFVLAVLSLFLVGSMAYATGTRVWTMGEANRIVKDEANIWPYPSTINYYPNLFLGEYEYGYEYDMYWLSDLYKIGGHLMFGDATGNPQVLGVYFSQDRYHSRVLDEFYDYYSDYSEDYYAGRGITLFYGREVSAMPFGLSLGYWFANEKNEDSLPSNNYEWGMSRYVFKVGLSPMMKQLDISGKLAITSWTDKEYYNADHGVVDMTKPDGNMDIRFLARYWMNPMGKYTFIPHGGFRMDNQGLEWYGQDASDHWVKEGALSMDRTMFGLGLGMNYDAGPGILVVGDIGFAYDKEKVDVDLVDNDLWGLDDYSEETGYTFLPYFKLGIDARVFSWMNLRAGVLTEWERWNHQRDYFIQFYPYYQYESGKWDRSGSEPYTYTYLGAGCHWGNFTLDAAINPEFLGNGPYFVSGDATNPLADMVSLKYNFMGNHMAE
jgi:hypothetical protein